jgi:hypothetical protein
MLESRAGRIVYRVRQFVGAVLAGSLPRADRAFVAQHLTTTQQTLFWRMPHSDQRHAMAVARSLLAQGWADRALLQAALLHDVGKSEGSVPLVYRAVIVLLRAVWPDALRRLADANTGWRRPFYVHARHPEIGARLALEVGSTTRVAQLIAQHQAFSAQASGGRASEHDQLAALQAADERY